MNVMLVEVTEVVRGVDWHSNGDVCSSFAVRRPNVRSPTFPNFSFACVRHRDRITLVTKYGPIWLYFYVCVCVINRCVGRRLRNSVSRPPIAAIFIADISIKANFSFSLCFSFLILSKTVVRPSFNLLPSLSVWCFLCCLIIISLLFYDHRTEWVSAVQWVVSLFLALFRLNLSDLHTSDLLSQTTEVVLFPNIGHIGPRFYQIILRLSKCCIRKPPLSAILMSAQSTFLVLQSLHVCVLHPFLFTQKSCFQKHSNLFPTEPPFLSSALWPLNSVHFRCRWCVIVFRFAAVFSSCGQIDWIISTFTVVWLQLFHSILGSAQLPLSPFINSTLLYSLLPSLSVRIAHLVSIFPLTIVMIKMIFHHLRDSLHHFWI